MIWMSVILVKNHTHNNRRTYQLLVISGLRVCHPRQSHPALERTRHGRIMQLTTSRLHVLQDAELTTESVSESLRAFRQDYENKQRVASLAFQIDKSYWFRGVRLTRVEWNMVETHVDQAGESIDVIFGLARRDAIPLTEEMKAKIRCFRKHHENNPGLGQLAFGVSAPCLFEGRARTTAEWDLLQDHVKNLWEAMNSVHKILNPHQEDAPPARRGWTRNTLNPQQEDAPVLTPGGVPRLRVIVSIMSDTETDVRRNLPVPVTPSRRERSWNWGLIGEIDVFVRLCDIAVNCCRRFW